jgi:hypothetical protein
MVPTLAFGYVVWVLLRGIDGSGRRLAIRIGAIAAGLATLQAVLQLASIGGSYWLTSLASPSADFDASLGWLATITTGGLWLSAIAPVLFVTAFALGIQDSHPSNSETPPA